MAENKKTSDRTYMFEQMPIPQAAATLCVPTIISSLVMMIYSMADTYFVGQLNDPVQTAAVTLAGPVLLAFNAVNNLFGVGSSSMMSRALGRKDGETVAKVSATGFYCSLFSAAIISLLCLIFRHPLLLLLGADAETMAVTSAYMQWAVLCGAIPAILNVVLGYMVRSEGAALQASAGTMSGCLLNIILDPLFILPQFLNMGAAGAGLATFISNCFACLYFLVLLLAVRKGRTFISLNPARISFRGAIFLGICAVGVPASIQNLLNVTGMTILNNFASSFGADAVSGMGIAQKVNQIPVYVALGTSQGIMALVSYNYSSGNTARMKQAVRFVMIIMEAFMVVMTTLMILFARPLIGTFMDTEAVVQNGTNFLRGFAMALPFTGMDFLGVGVFNACGNGRHALVFAILRKIVLEIPALFVLNMIFPLRGLAYAQFFAEFILAIAAFIELQRLFRTLEKRPQEARI